VETKSFSPDYPPVQNINGRSPIIGPFMDHNSNPNFYTTKFNNFTNFNKYEILKPKSKTNLKKSLGYSYSDTHKRYKKMKRMKKTRRIKQNKSI